MKVQAIKEGFIYGQVMKVGKEFTLIDVEEYKSKNTYKAKDQFSEKWMEALDKPKAKSK